MLTAMVLANYRSFYERQCLDLSDAGAPQCCHLFVGQPGTGKTNAIRSLKDLREALLDTPEQPRKRALTPFANGSGPHPSTLEVALQLDGLRYRYRVAMAGEVIVEEHLVAYPNGRPRRLFSRSRAADGNVTWVLHPSLGRTRAAVRKQLSERTLFLGRAGALGLSVLEPVYRWFRERLLIVETDELTLPRFTLKMLAQPQREQQVLTFLRRFQPHFDHLRLAPPKPAAGLPHAWQACLGPELALVYRHGAGSLVVPYDEEASTMRRLLTLAGPLSYALERGITLVVDALDADLQPAHAGTLVRLFEERAGAGAQLLFSAQSPQLAAELPPKQVSLFARDAAWASQVTRLDSAGARVRRALMRAGRAPKRMATARATTTA